jgi:hypothetical protein
MPIKTVTAKIGNMRKPQSFVIYPQSMDDIDTATLTIQSDDCIASLNTDTGVCRWVRNKGGAYFHNLMVGGNLGKGTQTLPPDLVEQFKQSQPQKGDTIGNGIVRIG